MPRLVAVLTRLYDRVFMPLQRIGDEWLLGLAARFVFAAVLLVFFLNSALTKIGPGPFGFLSPSVGAYAQILPGMMEAVSYDVSRIAFFPWGLIVLFGTWAEFVLPVMIVAGLFTRAASLAFIVFIAVMTYVDIAGHNVDAATIGALFDGDPGAPIADQRLLWGLLLLVLAVRGAGAVSVDWLLGRLQRR
jgi:putative oxidoreductase